MQILLNAGNMLIQYISVFSLLCINLVLSYNNKLYTLTSYENISESQCGKNTAEVTKKEKGVEDQSGKGGATIALGSSGLDSATTTTQATGCGTVQKRYRGPGTQRAKKEHGVLSRLTGPAAEKLRSLDTLDTTFRSAQERGCHLMIFHPPEFIPAAGCSKEIPLPRHKGLRRNIEGLFDDIPSDKKKLDVKPPDPITEVTVDNDGHDKQMHYPTGQFMRAELFNDKGSVHLPFLEYIHRGHCRLKITQDYMQTAVDAFAILVAGDLSDVERLPGSYVLQSARTISMMRIERQKLAAMWAVVKGDTRTEHVTYETLEKFRPLFKYVNGREIARLNLSDDKILMYVGTHPDLSRHQVGVVASKYITLNPDWTQPKYLNMMNNLLCGVPMNLMRRVPQNTYLQLTHQLFYHIRACDAIKRQFYLTMMMRTQALGKSYSWSAREVSRLGLLLTAVSGHNLSAVKPEAMAGITARVMLEMPVDSLRGITEMQLRHLDPKSLNILARKLIMSQTISAASYLSAGPFISLQILLIYISIVILALFEII